MFTSATTDREAPNNCGRYPEEIKFLNCTDYYYVGSICEVLCDFTQQRVGSALVECTAMPGGVKQWKPVISAIADSEIGTCEGL